MSLLIWLLIGCLVIAWFTRNDEHEYTLATLLWLAASWPLVLADELGWINYEDE